MTDRFDIELHAIEAEARGRRDLAEEYRMLSDFLADGNATRTVPIGMNSSLEMQAGLRHPQRISAEAHRTG